MDLVDTLKEFVMVPGVSGFEGPIRRYLLERLKDFEPEVDEVGNIIVSIGDGDESVAFMAHMDEIGFVTTHIEKNGYVRFSPVGGVDDRMLYGRVVEIFTESGIVYGVIGLSPPHLSTSEDMKKNPTWKELAIDVGARTYEEAIKIGVKPLQPGRWKKDFVRMGDFVVTRALDDRVGVAILYLLLHRLKDKDLKKRVIFIWTVQEETGLRGASALTTKMHFNEIYAIDTMTSGMMPGVAFHLSPVKIGEGPVLRFVDRRGVASEFLREKISRIARENGIPLQLGITGGSTDAAVAFNHGLRSIAICVPVKYTHSPVEMVHLADVKNTLDLLEKIVD